MKFEKRKTTTMNFEEKDLKQFQRLYPNMLTTYLNRLVHKALTDKEFVLKTILDTEENIL